MKFSPLALKLCQARKICHWQDFLGIYVVNFIKKIYFILLPENTYVDAKEKYHIWRQPLVNKRK